MLQNSSLFFLLLATLSLALAKRSAFDQFSEILFTKQLTLWLPFLDDDDDDDGGGGDEEEDDDDDECLDDDDDDVTEFFAFSFDLDFFVLLLSEMMT